MSKLEQAITSYENALEALKDENLPIIADKAVKELVDILESYGIEVSEPDKNNGYYNPYSFNIHLYGNSLSYEDTLNHKDCAMWNAENVTVNFQIIKEVTEHFKVYCQFTSITAIPEEDMETLIDMGKVQERTETYVNCEID